MNYKKLNYSFRNLSIYCTLLTLLLASCSGPAPTPTPTLAPPTATSTPVPTATLTPTPTSTSTPTPEPTPVFQLYQIPKVKDLMSFRAAEIEKWRGIDTDKDEISKKRKIEYSFMKEPYLLNVRLSGDFVDLEQFGSIIKVVQGLAGLLGSLGSGTAKNPELYLTEEDVYFRQDVDWMKISTGTRSLEDALLLGSPDIDTNAPEVLDWLKEVNYVGKETYNDVETWHYSFDQDCIDKSDLPSDMNVEEATGNLYLRVENPSYLVHLDMTLTGSNLRVEESIKPPIETGSLEYNIDFAGFNQTKPVLPVTLQEFGDIPEDIPIYGDAIQPLTMDLSVMGMKAYAFQVEASVNQVLSFYKTAMPKNGWKLESQDIASGNYTLVFNKDSRKVMMLIKPQAASTVTQFIFMLGI